MFNVCILTGPVLTEPKLKFFDSQTDTMFYLGISIVPYKGGVIKVSGKALPYLPSTDTFRKTKSLILRRNLFIRCDS
jgi:hypothetical protein